MTLRHTLIGAAGVTAATVMLGAAALPGASGPTPGDFRVPAPAVTAPAPAPAGLQTAVFSDGCFWGIQGLFQHVRGVVGTTAGYDGGATDTATYPQVSTGTTGHAESVAVTFDPRVVSYGTLIRILFSVGGNPTEVNEQTPDIGTQYRSMIWTRSAEQGRIADAYVHQLDAAHVFAAPIATKVSADHGFYPAEAYHQNYLVANTDQPYIAIYDLPKIAALHRLFPTEWQSQPTLAPARLADARS